MSVTIVDRQSRDRLVEAIESYLNDDATAFQFDEQIMAIRKATRDNTVHYAVATLWCFYDDLQDHKVHLTKEAWDFIQRLVLILKSDWRLEESHNWRWSFTQLVAAAGFVAFVALTAFFGLSWHLLFATIPLGGLAIAILVLRKREAPWPSRHEVALTPFAFFRELIALRRSVPGFAKQRYRPEVGARTVRTTWDRCRIGFQFHMCLVVLSPIALFALMFPRSVRQLRVRPSLPDTCVEGHEMIVRDHGIQ